MRGVFHVSIIYGLVKDVHPTNANLNVIRILYLPRATLSWCSDDCRLCLCCQWLLRSSYFSSIQSGHTLRCLAYRFCMHPLLMSPQMPLLFRFSIPTEGRINMGHPCSGYSLPWHALSWPWSQSVGWMTCATELWFSPTLERGSTVVTRCFCTVNYLRAVGDEYSYDIIFSPQSYGQHATYQHQHSRWNDFSCPFLKNCPDSILLFIQRTGMPHLFSVAQWPC